MRCASAGHVSVVYFTKVDRIGRNARDSLEIVEHLQRCGVKMVILDPRIDTTGMFGKFFFTMLAAMAALEAEWIAERTRGGKIEQLQQLEEAGRPIRAGHRNCSYGLRWVEAHYGRDTAEAAVILVTRLRPP